MNFTRFTWIGSRDKYNHVSISPDPIFNMLDYAPPAVLGIEYIRGLACTSVSVTTSQGFMVYIGRVLLANGLK